MKNEIRSFIKNHQKKISIILMLSAFALFGIPLFAYTIWPNYDGYLFDNISYPLHIILEWLYLVLVCAPYVTGVFLYHKANK